MQRSSTGRRSGRWRPFLYPWLAHWPSSSLAPLTILLFGPKTSMGALAPSVNLSAQMSSVPALVEELRNVVVFEFESSWLPLLLFCVRNSNIVRWTLTVSVNISLHNNWTSDWLGELKWQTVGFVWLMYDMYFLWLKLLYIIALNYFAPLPSQIFMLSTPVTLTQMSFALSIRDRIISVNSELHRNV